MKDLTPERLNRLLALINYFADGRRVTIAEAADHFGVTHKQLRDDIETLWVSGAPGYTHAELIDFEADAYEQGMVRLADAQQMDIPLRLSPVEAVTLLVALNSLIAHLGESDLLNRTLAKLRRAAGQAAAAADAIQIDRTPDDILALRDVLQEALSSQTQLRLRYVSGTHERTERTVDPLLLMHAGDQWVLTAWCYRARGVRNFRLDRILSADGLDTPVAEHEIDLEAATAFDTAELPHRVYLHLAASVRWIVDQLPVESTVDHPDGTFTIELAVANPAWVTQLVLGLGAAALGMFPPVDADRVRTRAREALEAYADVTEM